MKKSRLIALLQNLEGDPEIRVPGGPYNSGYVYATKVRQWDNGPARAAYIVTEEHSDRDFPETGCPVVRVKRKKSTPYTRALAVARRRRREKKNA